MSIHKLVILALFFHILAIPSNAQQHLLVIAGEPGKLYVEHVVDAKENWYSVGRLYNVSPRAIAPFNDATLNKPLEIGEHLKIPLTALNFTQTGTKASGESLVPVYHIVQTKEWMYHVSTTYNKVPIESLEKWNHVTRDQVKAGMQLIVGYLKVKTLQSALASTSKEQVAVVPSATVPTKKVEDKSSTVSVLPPPVVKEDKKPEALPIKAPAAVSVDPKPAESNPVASTNSQSTPVNYVGSVGGGFFSTEFVRTNKSLNGQAGTFKSTSGWQDGKYYALMNNVPVGTIVKVTSPANSKAIFAKVLGQLPEMKESVGLTIRVSSAAAAELGNGELKFPVEVAY